MSRYIVLYKIILLPHLAFLYVCGQTINLFSSWSFYKRNGTANHSFCLFFNEGFARTALVVCQKNINSFSLHVNLCSTIKTESTGLMSTPSWWRRCWKTGKTLWTLVCLCVPLCLIIVSYSSSQGEKSEKYSCGNKIFEGFFCVLLFTGIPHMHVFWDPVVY